MPTSTSMAVTNGVRVAVQARFVPEQSHPARRRYMWAYTIRISNEGGHAVQLVSRHWVITDAKGKVEEVKGPGVVGEQPLLQPGQSFEYTSGCMLETDQGTMQGTYQMVSEAGAKFDAEIAAFALHLPFNLN